MEPRAFHFTSGMDSIISILPSSWLFFFLGVEPFARKKYAPDLLTVFSPVYIWSAYKTLQAHKEERQEAISQHAHVIG